MHSHGCRQRRSKKHSTVKSCLCTLKAQTRHTVTSDCRRRRPQSLQTFPGPWTTQGDSHAHTRASPRVLPSEGPEARCERPVEPAPADKCWREALERVLQDGSSSSAPNPAAPPRAPSKQTRPKADSDIVPTAGSSREASLGRVRQALSTRRTLQAASSPGRLSSEGLRLEQ